MPELPQDEVRKRPSSGQVPTFSNVPPLNMLLRSGAVFPVSSLKLFKEPGTYREQWGARLCVSELHAPRTSFTSARLTLIITDVCLFCVCLCMELTV